MVVSRHLMSSHLIFFLRWLLMRCLLMRNLLTFSTKRSLMSSLLASWCMNLYNDVSRLLLRYLLMCDFFVEKVSRFLMSRHLMSSHLKKKKRRLLMRCLLIDTWTGLLWALLDDSWEHYCAMYTANVYNKKCNTAKTYTENSMMAANGSIHNSHWLWKA